MSDLRYTIKCAACEQFMGTVEKPHVMAEATSLAFCSRACIVTWMKRQEILDEAAAASVASYRCEACNDGTLLIHTPDPQGFGVIGPSGKPGIWGCPKTDSHRTRRGA